MSIILTALSSVLAKKLTEKLTDALIDRLETAIDTHQSSTTINGTSKPDYIENDGKKYRINGNGGADYLIGEGSNFTVNGGAGNDSIEVDGSHVKVFANTGNDYIDVEGSGVTVFGGEGNDTISLTDDEDEIDNVWLNVGTGDDVVTNYLYSDKVKLVTGDVTDINIDGEDVLLVTSSGSVRIKDSKGNLITTVDGSGNETTRTYTESSSSTIPSGLTVSSTKMTVSADYVGAVWLNGWDIFSNKAVYGSTSIVEIDATRNSKDLILAGNSQNNTIRAGSGDTQLWGGLGSGNDTLIGGNGDDVFWYGKGDGTDVINRCSDDDLLNLYNINLSDITSLDTSSDSQIVVNINDGGKLTVNTTGSTTDFKLGDGNTWQIDNSTKKWKAVK